MMDNDELESALCELAAKGQSYELRLLLKASGNKDAAIERALYEAIQNSGDGSVFGLCGDAELALPLRFAALQVTLKAHRLAYLELFFSALKEDERHPQLMEEVAALVSGLFKVPLRADIAKDIFGFLALDSVPLSLKLNVVKACEETLFAGTVAAAGSRLASEVKLPEEVAHELDAAHAREVPACVALRGKIMRLQEHIKEKNATDSSSRIPSLQSPSEQSKKEMSGLTKPKEPVRAVEQPFRAKLFARG